jgi:hypothetical protein
MYKPPVKSKYKNMFMATEVSAQNRSPDSRLPQKKSPPELTTGAT